jgi:uncharacterized protein YjeT (DUF2065 family)
MLDFLVGLGVMFVIEGLMLAGFPNWTRSAMASVIATPDQFLRVVGLVSAVVGTLIIWIVRHH